MKTIRSSFASLAVLTLNFSALSLHAQVATTGSVSPAPTVSPTWNLPGQELLVGASATGTLTISSGGLVSNLLSSIGSGGSGTVTVNGGTWTTTSGLDVGASSGGQLFLNGGQISDNLGMIGRNAGITGTATVTSGTWTNSSGLRVGYGGMGNLIVSGGLVDVNGITTAAWQTGSTGSITLSGIFGNQGTLFTTQLEEFIGTGTVTFDGGILKARADQSSFIHQFEPGDVTINSGGAFIDSNGFAIGTSNVLGGTGALSKLGLGTLTLTGANTYTGGTIVNSGTLTLGSGGSISTPAAVTYVGSGSGDVGALQFSGGTVSNNNAYVGRLSGSQGSATVTSGNWTNSGTLWVGYSGTGTLLVNGGTVSSVFAVLGFTATTGIGSATVSSGTWTNSSDLLVGRAGAGSLNVSGGLMTVEGITYTGFFGGSTGSITLSGTDGNRGTLLTNKVAENSGVGTLTFDGGVLKARGDESDFISAYEPGDVTINAGGAFIFNDGFAIGISSVLGGTGGLTKQGFGTLTLSGANTYSGGTTVYLAKLLQGASGAFVANTAYSVNNGGTLDLNDFDLTASSLDGNTTGFVDLGTAHLTVDQSVTTTFAGSIYGTGALTKKGSGTLNLTGNNSYNGGITVDAGTLYLGTMGAANSNNAYTVNGGSLGLANFDLTVTSFGGAGGTVDLGGGRLIVNQAGNASFAGAIQGTGGLAKLGADTLTLSGASNYTGGTSVSAGKLLQGSNGAFSNNTAYTVNGSTLDLNDFDLTASSLDGDSTATVDFGTASLTVNQSGTTAFAGAIIGTGGFSKQGSGTLSLSGTNTYTGGTTVDAGTLDLGTSSAAVPNTACTVNGGSLTLGNFNLTVSSFGGTGGVMDVGSGRLIVDQVANTSFAGVIQGTGGLTKEGLGTLTLIGANAYTGSTTVAAGTLLQGAGGAFVINAAYTVNNGGTLDLNDFDLTASSFVGVLGATVDLGTGHLTVDQTGDTQYAGAMIGTGGLIKQGTGKLTLSGPKTYTGGTTVEAGTLSQSGNAFVNNTAYTVNGGMLDVLGQSLVVTSLSGTGGTVNVGSNLYVIQADNTSYAGDIIGTGRLAKSGAGTLTLTGTNTYSGGTSISAGMIRFSSGDNLGTSYISVVDSGGLQWATGNTSDISDRLTSVATLDTNGNDVTLASDFNSSYLLTKRGLGTLTLSGTDVLSNGITVKQGTVTLGATGAVSGGTFNVGQSSGDLGALMFSGGTISSAGSLIGNGAGSQGSATVTSGSWTNSSLLTVGNSGTGSLLVNGGTVSNSNGTLGNNLGGSGSATVSSGSWTNYGTLTIGNSGTGSLLVNGGTVSNTSTGVLGFNTSGDGTVTVSSGSWENSGPLQIGRDGTGSLQINGGMVSNTIGNIGFRSGSVGTVTVSSGTWTNSTRIIVGNFGTGSLLVEGGLVTATGITHVGGYNTATGTGSLTLSGTPGNRGTLSTDQILEGLGTGTVAFNGGILQARVDESDFISAFEDGDVTINSGGAFIDSNSFAIGISTQLGGLGGLTKQGVGTLTMSGTHTYTGVTTVAAGTLLVDGSLATTAVNVQSGGFGGTGSLGGDLTLASGTTLVLGVTATAINGPVVAGTSTLNGSITVSPVRSGGTLVPGTYTVLAFSGSLLGSPAFTWSDPEGQLLATSFTTTANEVQVTLEIDPQAALHAWRQLHFGSIDDIGDGANLNDFDHDRLVNLIEFAFGLDPKQNSAGQLPEAQLGGGNLITTFSTPVGVSGITYGAEWSATLGNDWLPITDTGSAPEHIFSMPVDSDRKFLRLTVAPSP